MVLRFYWKYQNQSVSQLIQLTDDSVGVSDTKTFSKQLILQSRIEIEMNEK